MQLLNDVNERYPLSFTLKSNEPSNYDDPTDSVAGEASEDQLEDQDGPSQPKPWQESADAVEKFLSPLRKDSRIVIV